MSELIAHGDVVTNVFQLIGFGKMISQRALHGLCVSVQCS